MSASLVGSEMCIRDRVCLTRSWLPASGSSGCWPRRRCEAPPRGSAASRRLGPTAAERVRAST
eukprot:346056-Alexandrium_andersonii.AAC.1